MAKSKLKSAETKRLTYNFTAGTGVSIRNFRVYQTGNVVEVVVYFDVTSAVSNNGTIVSVGSDRLPKPVVPYAVATARALNGNIAVVSIETAGPDHIAAWGTVPTGEYYCAQFCYLTGYED